MALLEGLPYDDAATWRQDRPGWTRQDEWMARLVESLEHWGPLGVLVHTGRNGRVPPVRQLFEHPDRHAAGKKSEPTADADEISRFFAHNIGGG